MRSNPKTVRAVCNVSLLLLSFIALSLQTGCGLQKDRVLGEKPEKLASFTVQQVRKVPVGKRVTLQGEMIAKCPVAGCWFMLRDKTGVVRVDTKAAGFVVAEVPLHTQMTVTGSVSKEGETGLNATGLRY